MIDDGYTVKERGAVAANEAFFNEKTTQKYADVSPHVKYASLRRLYGRLVKDVYAYAHKHAEVPTVLDLGAGEGSATLPFLESGARVVAVDVSESQLSELRKKCGAFNERLEIRLVDIDGAFRSGEHYDVVLMSSCLHHIPDYISVIQSAAEILSPKGQFFSFQDPIRYDTMDRPSYWFNRIVYFSWRAFQGDFFGGLSRTLRRARGVYLDDCAADNTEYHVVRNGVDQNEIVSVLSSRGFECRTVRYFSTQGSLFQPLGAVLGIENTFSIIARR